MIYQNAVITTVHYSHHNHIALEGLEKYPGSPGELLASVTSLTLKIVGNQMPPNLISLIPKSEISSNSPTPIVSHMYSNKRSLGQPTESSSVHIFNYGRIQTKCLLYVSREVISTPLLRFAKSDNYTEKYRRTNFSSTHIQSIFSHSTSTSYRTSS